MANSSSVSAGDVATASQYNNLRLDVLDTSTGHTHNETDSKGLAINSTNFEYASNVLAIKDDGISGAELNADCVDDSTIEQTGTTFNVKDAGITSAKLSADVTAEGTWSLTTTPYVVPEGRYMCLSGTSGNAWGIQIQVASTWQPVSVSASIQYRDPRYIVSDGTNVRVFSAGTTTVHYLKF